VPGIQSLGETVRHATAQQANEASGNDYVRRLLLFLLSWFVPFYFNPIMYFWVVKRKSKKILFLVEQYLVWSNSSGQTKIDSVQFWVIFRKMVCYIVDHIANRGMFHTTCSIPK
jgi:hypothetical protein